MHPIEASTLLSLKVGCIHGESALSNTLMKEVKDRIRDRRPSGNVRFAGAFLVLFAFWVVLLSILKLGNQPEAENIDKIDADNRKMEGMHDYDASYMEGAASPQEKWLLRSAVAQASLLPRECARNGEIAT